MRKGTRNRLAYCACVAAAVLLGIWLRVAGLDASLMADDYDHYAMQRDIYPLARHPLDFFNFVSEGEQERNALLRFGRLPWWSDPHIELSMLRPLSSALIAFDYEILHGVPRHMHMHSMFWWVLLVLGVAALLHSVLPAPIAALATLLYALDEAHGLSVGWIANRSALVSVALLCWGLWVHVRYRTLGMRGGEALSLCLVALALLAGEHAVPPLAYFVCFELLARRDRPTHRVRALLPVVALGALYLAVRHALGYGVSGSGFYIDPIDTPLRYLEAGFLRLPLLLGDLGFGMGAEWFYYGGPPFRSWLIEHTHLPAAWLAVKTLQQVQVVLCVFATLAVLWLLFWMRRSAVYWLLSGALLALLPMCATLPMSRLTLAAAIGADAAIAVLIYTAVSVLFSHGHLARRLLAGVLALSLLSVHGLYAAVRTRDDVSYHSARSHIDMRWVIEARIDDSKVQDQTIFVVAAADWLSQWALPFVRHWAGRPVPKATHLLSAAFGRDHTLVRTADRTLILTILDGQFGSDFAGSVYRSKKRPFRSGQERILPSFRTKVLAVHRGQPSRIRFTFPNSLDDPRYLFLYSHNLGLHRLRLPEVGERILLPAPAIRP